MTTNRPKPCSFPSHTGPLAPTNDPDHASDDENDEDIDDLASDTQSLIGVSIGQAQSRLNSPSATVGEKAAAINLQSSDDRRSYEQDFATPSKLEEDTRGDPSIPLAKQPKGLSLSTVDESPPSADEDQLPSPWRAGPNALWSIDGALGQGSRATRARALTGLSPQSDGTGWRRLMPSLGFPQLPKVSSLSHRFSFANLTGSSPSANKNQSQHSMPVQGPFEKPPNQAALQPQHDGQPSSASLERSVQPPEAINPKPQTRSATPDQHSASARPALLRRTTSDRSVRYLQRSMSRASSLGDDERWTDVHEQVNSRMKAIKDSLADSKLTARLPRMPELPSLGFDSSWLDLQTLRKRAGSLPLPSGRETRKRSPDKTGTRTRGSVGVADAYANPASQSNSSRTGTVQHPHFTRALDHLTGDVVVLGGYRGSILRSAEPPHRQCWVPIKVGLNLRKVDLEVGLEASADERMEKNIIADGMLKNIGPVDISRRLFKRLRSSRNAMNGKLRVWDFGYDWRLNPHLLSSQLLKFLRDLPCNSKDVPPEKRGATVIAHSLGGLITRHAINKEPHLVAGVVYAGVPQTCVNILGPLRNGDDVLLSSKVLTAQVNFTIRTSFALLPLDGKCFVNRTTNEEYPVDFFDAKTWEEYCLSPCIARPRPPRQGEGASGTVGSIVSSMSSVLPSLARRRSSSGGKRDTISQVSPLKQIADEAAPRTQTVNPQMDRHTASQELGENPETSPSTAVTIPRDAAVRYLERTLAEVKRFKQELAFDEAMAERGAYPPAAVIYGKSVPTVYGANVASRAHICHANAYDNLAFASGDGVVLARAAQLPEGYKVARGGVVSSDRGHVSLLGDLEAVGRCLNAVRVERRMRRRAGTGSEADSARAGAGAQAEDRVAEHDYGIA